MARKPVPMFCTAICFLVVLCIFFWLGSHRVSAIPPKCKSCQCLEVVCLGTLDPNQISNFYYRWKKDNGDGSFTEYSQAQGPIACGSADEGDNWAEVSPVLTLKKYQCSGDFACILGGG